MLVYIVPISQMNNGAPERLLKTGRACPGVGPPMTVCTSMSPLPGTGNWNRSSRTTDGCFHSSHDYSGAATLQRLDFESAQWTFVTAKDTLKNPLNLH